jgi:hypothetical protein
MNAQEGPNNTGSAGKIAIRLMKTMISSFVSKVKRLHVDAGMRVICPGFSLAVCSWFQQEVHDET